MVRSSHCAGDFFFAYNETGLVCCIWGLFRLNTHFHGLSKLIPCCSFMVSIFERSIEFLANAEKYRGVIPHSSKTLQSSTTMSCRPKAERNYILFVPPLPLRYFLCCNLNKEMHLFLAVVVLLVSPPPCSSFFSFQRFVVGAISFLGLCIFGDLRGRFRLLPFVGTLILLYRLCLALYLVFIKWGASSLIFGYLSVLGNCPLVPALLQLILRLCTLVGTLSCLRAWRFFRWYAR